MVMPLKRFIKRVTVYINQSLVISMMHFTSGFALLLPRISTLIGGLLIEKSGEIAEKLSLPDFKASNSWLDRWNKRHTI